MWAVQRVDLSCSMGHIGVQFKRHQRSRETCNFQEGNVFEYFDHEGFGTFESRKRSHDLL